MHESMGGRRKRGLSQSKAKKMAHEGLSQYGNGFASDRQKHYIGMIAGGTTPMKAHEMTASKRRKRKR